MNKTHSQNIIVTNKINVYYQRLVCWLTPLDMIYKLGKWQHKMGDKLLNYHHNIAIKIGYKIGETLPFCHPSQELCGKPTMGDNRLRAGNGGRLLQPKFTRIDNDGIQERQQ